VNDVLRYLDAAMYPDRAPYDDFGKLLFAPLSEKKTPKVRQGLGWALVEEDRSWLVTASAATCGFSCCSMFSPSKRKAVIVLSNHVDIGGVTDLVRAWTSKRNTVQGATQLLYDAI